MTFSTNSSGGRGRTSTARLELNLSLWGVSLSSDCTSEGASSCRDWEGGEGRGGEGRGGEGRGGEGRGGEGRGGEGRGGEGRGGEGRGGEGT